MTTGCSEEGGVDAPEAEAVEVAKQPNVLLVLVDTLRADHLGIYGYERRTSPQIDLFARQSLRFNNSRAQAPCTFPSVNSLLTSRDPSLFLGRETGDVGIPESVKSLAEVYGENGYRSVAVSASAIVRKSPSPHNKVGGYDRGFEVFDERCLRRPAGCVNNRAFALLDEASADERPFFMYLHYLDPHGPYKPPPRFARRFSGGYEGKDFIANGDPNPIAKMIYKKDAEKVELVPEDIAHLIDLYDDEIVYFDTNFRRLLDGVKERGLSDDTIIVLLSDHGEDFLERSDIKHCRSLHETQIWTPMVLRIPGVEGRQSFDAAVGNIDVAPTLLDYSGIDATGQDYEGRSLRAVIEGTSESAAQVFSSWQSRRSVVEGAHKLILDRRTDEQQLFDVVSDPLERTDLSAEKPELAQRLRAVIEGRIERLERDRLGSIEMGDKVTDQLKALGYLE